MYERLLDVVLRLLLVSQHPARERQKTATVLSDDVGVGLLIIGFQRGDQIVVFSRGYGRSGFASATRGFFFMVHVCEYERLPIGAS